MEEMKVAEIARQTEADEPRETAPASMELAVSELAAAAEVDDKAKARPVYPAIIPEGPPPLEPPVLEPAEPIPIPEVPNRKPYNHRILSSSCDDHLLVSPGQHFSVRFTLLNTGSEAWPANGTVQIRCSDTMSPFNGHK